MKVKSMDNHQPDIRGLLPEEIGNIINTGSTGGVQKYRAAQVFRWVQAWAAQNWTDMTNIGAAAQELLAQHTCLHPLEAVRESVSKDGTRKYLWRLADHNIIESVLLRHEGSITKTRHTVCLSTQVGCPMGCSFCATGKIGWKRNLDPGEIAAQVLDLTFMRRRQEPEFKVGNVVYMGMGEPLLNLPAVVKSIRILNHQDGQNIGIRRITVSTCGLVPQIGQLAEEDLDIVLAVSLHAPTNELRNRIMPVNIKYPVEELIAACRRYIEKTGRRVTFEYALIKNFNDGYREARQLSLLLQGIKANVNVIPVNTVRGADLLRPGTKEVRNFVRVLQGLGVNAVPREEKGSDIAAACGQLAGT